MRIEERKRVRGISIDESKLTPQEKEWVREGMDPECVRIIEDNFLARPKQALLMENPMPDIPQSIKDMYVQYHKDIFNRQKTEVPSDFVHIFRMYDKSPELQTLFRDASPELRNVFNKYKKIIAPKYRCVINDTKRYGMPFYTLSHSQNEK